MASTFKTWLNKRKQNENKNENTQSDSQEKHTPANPDSKVCSASSHRPSLPNTKAQQKPSPTPTPETHKSKPQHPDTNRNSVAKGDRPEDGGAENDEIADEQQEFYTPEGSDGSWEFVDNNENERFD